MKVFLTSAYQDNFGPQWLQKNDALKAIFCTDDPAQADLILFVEGHPDHDPYFRQVLNHPVYKKYPRKCVLYHDADLSVTAMPTLSPSIEAWQYDPRHKRVAHYIARLCENDAVNNSPIDYEVPRTYLYSFIGSRTHPVRDRIFAMPHAPQVFVKDTSGLSAWKMSPAEKADYEATYFDVLNKSAFVLTPRGFSPCSYRLFETMQLGRVPVIISDQWVRIPGMDWDQFSLQIPEADLPHLAAILNERKAEAIEMGRAARWHWENFFSPGVSLYRLSLAAAELLQQPYGFADYLKDHTQFVTRPWHLRNFVRSRIKGMLHR